MTASSFDRPTPTHARLRRSLAGCARTTLTAALIGLIVAVGAARARSHELGTSMRVHCNSIARSQESIAVAVDGMAGAHRQLARQAQP